MNRFFIGKFSYEFLQIMSLFRAILVLEKLIRNVSVPTLKVLR
ncbi:hypothetical protein LEP1GSC106_1613 [Leptospira interrogans serovar Grippotyphosa str. UI 12764]|nr:hypothetical protein LEP1GSC106_1613 [Leptospira interrogans serovar Grippotyphosa str. UI 12764]